MMKLFMIAVLFPFMGCQAQLHPVFKTLRYEEDHSQLSTDTAAKFYNSLKHFYFSGNRGTYVSLGGDGRLQYLKYENEDWGDTPESTDGYLLARYLLHTDVRVQKNVRAFIQLQGGLARGKKRISALDHSPAEIHQVFVDYTCPLNATAKLTLRAGRQEMLYGSQRMISVREGPNKRQAFDGMKAIIGWNDRRLDVFYTTFVHTRNGSFNDRFTDDTKLWASYFTMRVAGLPGSADIYYMGFEKRRAVYDDGAGREWRHSAGGRIWKTTDPFGYDIEGIWQFGTLGKQEIQAWTISIKLNYLFDQVKLKPHVGFKTELISGDRKQADRQINTFNPLFPSGAYFGLAAVFGPANLFDIHPSIALNFGDDVTWNCEYESFWRFSNKDGIYTNNTELIYSGESNPHAWIGHQFSTDVRFAISPFANLKAEFKWFVAEDFLKNAGAGKDILFSAVTFQGIF